MPKYELDPENNVNTNAWYDEAIIFKIWDQYIKFKKLKYYYSNSDSYNDEEHYIESIFEGKDESLLSKNAAILLNKDNSLYIRENFNNNEVCSISLCNLASTINTKKESFNFKQKENYVKIALKQLKEWNKLYPNNKNTINNHIIMFPYNIRNKHWCLGTLQIKFNFPTIDACLHIYDPLKVQNIFDKYFIKKINQLLISNFSDFKINLNNKYNKLRIKQQNDPNSCGVIVAENGKDIIIGSDERLKKIYSAGAKILRIQHLNEIANDVFTLRQKENKFYINPEIQLLDNFSMIENELSYIFSKHEQINAEFRNVLNEIKKNIKYDEVSAVGNIRNLFLKYMNHFKDYSINNKNLFEIFFSDDNGSYQDKAFDTLAYIIQKILDNEKFNQKKLNHYNNSYHYPERIPNLVQRNYLKNRIKEDLQTNRIAILTGLNGYGKTSLAIDYIYTHLNGETEYDYIIWLDCQELFSTSLYSTGTIKYIAWNKGTRSFNKMIKYLSSYPNNEEMHCIYFRNIRDIHKIISKEVLGKTWLIVYDNVTNYADLVQESIPPNGHIICTSRYKNWPKSINVGPFTKDESIQYFTNIFFQSPESAAAEQYRDKYFENMLGTPDKTECFHNAAEELIKKLHGYPLAVAIAASDINKKGLTVEKYVREKKYKELPYFNDITLENFINIDLSKIKNGNKAKQLLEYCAYLNHEGINREILEEIDRKIIQKDGINKFDLELFNSAINLLIYYSIINTDNSHAIDYFYIPDILKKIILNHLNKEQKFNIQTIIVKIINRKIKKHVYNNNCNGEEIINPEENIYMWIAHAKELYKNLEWRKNFDNEKINSRNKGYRLIDIKNIIDLYIRNKFPNSKKIYLSNLINDCFLLMRANKKIYTCIDISDGYNYSFILSAPINDIFLKYKTNTKTSKARSSLNFFNKICHSEANSHYKILIPYLDSTLRNWITIEIKLHKFIIKNKSKYELELLAHDPYGDGDILKNCLKKFSKEFLNHLNSNLFNINPNSEINSTVKDSSYNKQLQKHDTTSSSIIIIENIIDIIHGKPLIKIYPFGCKIIRYQHLALVARYIPVSKNKIWYKNIDKEKIKLWKKFLERHWGLKYLLNEYPKNIKTLKSTANFLHFLGWWYYYHEMLREKSYTCFLESSVLYFQLICAKILKNKEYNYDKTYNDFLYDKIYNNHLKDSYNFEDTNQKLISSDYKLSHETPIIHISLTHIVKVYTQLEATYEHYLHNCATFDVNKESIKWQVLQTLYYLSTSLHKAKKGFNPKTQKWMNALHKLFSHLLKGNLTNSNLKIKEDIFKILLPDNTIDKILFDDFKNNELIGHNLNFLELKQTRLKSSKLKLHIKKILESIKIPEEILDHYKRHGEKKFQSEITIKNYIIDLINKYISHYYTLLSQNINIIYDKFLDYAERHNSDPNRAKDVRKFIIFFKLNDKKFNTLFDKEYNKIKINKLTKISTNPFDINSIKESYIYLISQMSITPINEKYFSEDCQILSFFYKIIYRKLTLIFLKSFNDEKSRINLNIKLNLLKYIIDQVSDDIINSKANLISSLIFKRLKIKIQLEIYFLYSNFDVKIKKNLRNLSKIFNELVQFVNDYYETLIKNINNIQSNDIEEVFKKSGRLFYKIAKIAFRHLKISLQVNFSDKLDNSQGEFFKNFLDKLQKILTGKTSDKLNISQSKLFMTVVVNLQRAFNSHKIRLLQSEHSYLVKASNLYDEILKYLGFNTDPTDKSKRIGSLIDIDFLEKTLNTLNEHLASYRTLDIIKDQNRFSEMLRARMNRAMICYMLCRYQEALNDCNKLCNENKTYFKAFHFRAHIYCKLKKYPEAINDFNYYLKYCPGDYNAKVWLSWARKQEELKFEHTPPQHITPKMLFINKFTDEFLIEVKSYTDISSGTNKIFNKSEMTARILGALSKLLPNIGVSVPISPISPTLTINPQEAGIGVANIYAQQAEAKKLYIASNIAYYHNELKGKVQSIAENIANDLESQIKQLQDKSVIELAKYSAKRMLKNVGLNKTNPELPIEQQLRQGLFLCEERRKKSNVRLSIEADTTRSYSIRQRWTAEGILTHAGIFTTSNHFWVQKEKANKVAKYGYRYGTNEEAFRLGYTQVNKDKKNGKEHESKYRIAIPFPNKQ